MMTTCTAVTKSGQPCPNLATGDDDKCFSHSPRHAAARAAGSRKGGHNRANVERISKRLPRELRDVLDRLLAAVPAVEDGTLTPSQAQALSSLAGAIMRLYEGCELEARIKKLEGHDDGA